MNLASRALEKCPVFCRYRSQSLASVLRAREGPPVLSIVGRAFSSQPDPHQVLRIPPESSYSQAKEAFIQLAHQYHPDKETGCVDTFLRVRRAFEALQEAQGIKEDESTMNEWFHQETGEFLTSEMTESTRQEVLEAFRTLKPSGLDKGGYWTMARMLAERDTGGTEVLKRIESGPESSIRHRRRRRRRMGPTRRQY